MIALERLYKKRENADADADKLEDHIWSMIKEIERKSPAIIEEFRALTKDEQEAVAETVTSAMDEARQRNLMALIPGSLIVGATIGKMSGALGANNTVLIGGIAAVVTTGLVPVIEFLKKRNMNKFFGENKKKDI